MPIHEWLLEALENVGDKGRPELMRKNANLKDQGTATNTARLLSIAKVTDTWWKKKSKPY